jgi:exopolyphosphatase/guanosine-5'-triphosphate,3'-diphosphate pyrophosphatase
MGCVGYSLQVFSRTGRSTSVQHPKEAEMAARQRIADHRRTCYREAGWEEAVGSSGTAKAIADLLELNGLVRKRDQS